MLILGAEVTARLRFLQSPSFPKTLAVCTPYYSMKHDIWDRETNVSLAITVNVGDKFNDKISSIYLKEKHCKCFLAEYVLGLSKLQSIWGRLTICRVGGPTTIRDSLGWGGSVSGPFHAPGLNNVHTQWNDKTTAVICERRQY